MNPFKDMNPLAMKMAAAATRSVRSRIKKQDTTPICGWGWCEMYRRDESPQCGVSMNLKLKDGTEVRLSLDVLPGVKS
jgi:hypothetical protein